MAPRPKPPPAYRQIDFLRDATLAFYIVFLLANGLQHLLLGGSSGFGGGSVINQAMTVLVLASATLCALYQRVSLPRLLHGVSPYIVPTLLVLASLTWSDHFDIGARRALRFCIELAGLLLLVSCYRDSRSFLRTLWMAFIILAGLDVLSLAVPHMSITSIGFAGVHGHKNTLGSFAYAAIPVFFLAWRTNLLGRWSLVSLGAMLLTMAMLVASLSKTAIFLTPFCAFLAFIGYRIWQRGLTTQLALGGLFIALVIVVALPLAGSGMNFAEFVGAITGDPTITGRSEVWEYTFYRVGDRALTGVGYGSFWDVDSSSQALMNQYGVTFAFNQSHNGYIGVFAELGWLGVGAIILMWLMATSAIMRRVGNTAEWPLVGYGLYTALGYVLYNVTETSFFRVGFDTWVEYVVISAAVAKLVTPAPLVRRAAGRLRAPMRRRTQRPPGVAGRPPQPRPVGRPS